MLSRIGLSSALARSRASSPQGYQSTGLWACLQEVWARLIDQAVGHPKSRFPARGLGVVIEVVDWVSWFIVPHTSLDYQTTAWEAGCRRVMSLIYFEPTCG